MEQHFMMLFRMAPSNEQPTPEQLQQMEQSWGAFFGSIGANMVSTNHLGFTGVTIAADHSTTEGFHVAEGHMVAGNLVVKADSMEAAIAMAKQCPILHAGGTVEVRDIMPM
jgi:type IV secretory pathway TrbF-like protein